MSTTVHIIWDFDAAIGQINATFPYNYNEVAIYREIENVQRILEIAKRYNVRFTFAITGFSAEEGVFPFHVPDLIRRIYSEGHEIASHTWRHEWLPVIQLKQIVKTMERSRYALEKCIGVKSSVIGLVLPHNRPMSWYKKGAFSIGDRAVWPFYKGADLGSVLKIARKCGYKWVRVSYRPIYQKILGINDPMRRKWERLGSLHVVPMQLTGFGSRAIKIIEQGIALRKNVVLSGHPLMLSRSDKIESEECLIELLEYVQRNRERIGVSTVRNSI